MDHLLSKSSVVLFCDDSDNRLPFIDIFDGSVRDMTLDIVKAYLNGDSLRGIFEKVSQAKRIRLYLQRDCLRDQQFVQDVLSQLLYYCDGFVSPQEWWFKTGSTKVVSSTQATRPVPTSDQGLQRADIAYGPLKNMGAVLQDGGEAGFDSDDPDADLDV
jgi:hypothetical protein